MKRILLLIQFLPFFVNGQIITTIAGNGTNGFSGDGGPATNATINVSGYGCAYDATGNLYFVDFDSSRVRKINAAGIITTIAGTGVAGYNGDNIPATSAMLHGPNNVAVDKAGNVFISEGWGRIRKITTVSGIITTVAGNGVDSCSIRFGVPATSVNLCTQHLFCIDQVGNLFLPYGEYIAKIDTNGIINRFAGNGLGGPFPLRHFTPQIATLFALPPITDIRADKAGNLFVSYNYLPYRVDTTYSGIYKIDTSQIMSEYAGTGYNGNTGDGGAAIDAEISPGMIIFDNNGNLFIDEYLAVRRVDLSGTICTVAGNGTVGYSGDGGPATDAQLRSDCIATDTSGNLYITSGSRIRKVTQPECGFIFPLEVVNLTKTNQCFVYPNPATTSLTITSGENIKTITITNLLGQPIYTHQYNTTKAEVDVSNLPTGIYLIRINGTEVRKFVKE